MSVGPLLLLMASLNGTAGAGEPLAAARADRLQTLESLGLSRSDVLDRVEEWEAKGAPPERVLELLAALSDSVRASGTVLRQSGLSATPNLLKAAAAALQSGVHTEHLTQALQGARNAFEAQARCLALSTLVVSGYAPPYAAELVRLASTNGYDLLELQTLVASAQRLSRETAAPREVLVGHLENALRQSVRAPDLYPTVRQALNAPVRGGRGPAPESGFNHPVLRAPGKP